MIDDQDLQYNMALYMAVMEKKFQNVKEKRKELQKVLYNAASKIQRMFRRFSLKKRTRASIRIQRWWRRATCRLSQREAKVQKFKRLFYGLIILNFMQNGFKTKTKSKPKQAKPKRHPPILKRVTKIFPTFIAHKSALMAEHKYINKYRQYLKQKFDNDWQKYEKKLTKDLWKQINKKWVKIQSKGKGKSVYLNDQDKEVDAQEYISNKLNKMYEDLHQKLQMTEASLKNNQSQINWAIKSLEHRYQQKILQF